MKQIFKYLGIAAITCSLFTSCSDDDQTGLSTIDYSSTVVTLTSSENNISLDETLINADNGYPITVTATIDNPLPIDLVIPLTDIGGTGSEDFSAESITIKSSFTTGSTTVIINRTGNLEGDETIVIGPVEDAMIPNATVNPFSLVVDVVNDYVDYVATFNFDWSGYVYTEDAEGAESDASFCAMDTDYYFLDTTGNDTGNYDAATTACPEEISIDASTYADGTYSFYADLYSNPYDILGEGVSVPINITVTQGYFVNVSGTPGFEFNTDDGAGAGAMIMEFTIASGIITDVTFL